MGRGQEFLNLFNQLDERMRARLGSPKTESHAQLIEKLASVDTEFRTQASLLHACRALRNSIVHIASDGTEAVIAEPSASLLDRYRRFVEYAKAPPRALDTIAVRDVYTVQWESLVLVELRHMLARSFRLAPVCDNDRLVGVFTETALCQFAVRAGGFALDNRTTFAELRTECELTDTLGTVQRQAALAPESARIDEIEQQFREYFKKDVALTVVLITKTGSVGEPILGIVTAHDLPSASGKSVIDARP
jgi:hypothetical protein